MTAFIDDSILEAVYDYLVKGTAAGTSTATWRWLGLLDDTDTEVSGGSYARIDISSLRVSTTPGIVEIGTTVNFTNMPSTTVRSWGLWTASTAGTMMVSNDFVSDVPVTSGQTFTINAGDLVLGITLDTGCGMARPHRTQIASYLTGNGSLVGKAENFRFMPPDQPLEGLVGPYSLPMQWDFEQVGFMPDFDDFNTASNEGTTTSIVVNRIDDSTDGADVTKCGVIDAGTLPSGGYLRLAVPLTVSDTPDPDENIYIMPGDMVISLEPQ